MSVAEDADPQLEQEGTHALWRVLEPLKRAGAINTQAAIDGWTKVFEFDGKDPTRLRKVTRRLLSLQEELDRAYARMSETRLTPVIYNSAFHAAQSALQVAHLTATWDTVKQHLTHPSMNMLLGCAQLLHCDEAYLSRPARRELADRFVELRRVVHDDASLADELKDMLIDQLLQMELAIRAYEVRGVVALRMAAYRLDGALDMHFGSKPAAPNSTVSRIRDALHTVSATVARCATAAGLVLLLPKVGEVAAETELYWRGMAPAISEEAGPQLQLPPAMRRVLTAGQHSDGPASGVDFEVSGAPPEPEAQ